MTHFLNVQMLGGFQLLYAGELIAVRSARVQTLLAYLLLHQHKPQPRQQIASHLWPDSPETQARANLRKLLHQLRQVLPESHRFLQIEADTLRWRKDAAFTFDVDQFEDTMSQAKTAAPSQQRAFLERAVELYKGDLLPVCYDDWIRLKREQLRQTHQEMLHDLIQLLEAQGKYQSAIQYARQLCQIDPLREVTYRQLMRLYSLNGEKASVIEIFRRCEQLLNEELAVEPSTATRDLYAQILAADRHEQPRHNLPEQLTSFVGRGEELAIISKRLQEENCRLLTLVGSGGIGKTRLALQAAFLLIDVFADGVYFVSLEPVSVPNLFVTAVAEALNFSFYSSHDLKQQLVDYLRPKQTLLILDSFEHLLEAAGLLTEVLSQTQGVKVLVTSRERLKLPHEWLLEVEGLPWPKEFRDDDLEEYGAVQLFTQRARQVRPRLVWTAPEREAVVNICQQLEGMPLGIELAAVWLRVLSCTEIERELNRNLDMLAGVRSNLPPRHRSLRAVFEQSWNFLSATEQRLWAKLAVFHGRFDHQAAAQVAGASLSSLMSFVDKSLLRLDGSGLFSIHSLIRQYGVEKLRASAGELAATRDAHSDYYLRFLHERQRALLGQEQPQILAEIAGVIENIRAAWQWSVTGIQVAKLMHSADTLARFYQMRGWFEEGREQFSQACIRARQQLAVLNSDPEIALLLSRMLVHEGLFHLRLSDFATAAKCLEEAITIGSRLNNRQELARATIRLGEVRYREGEYLQTQQLCQEGLEISQALGESDDAARAFSILAQVAHVQGHYDEAYQFFEQSRALSKELGDSWSLAHVYNNLGMVSHDQGRYEAAWQHFQESLTLFSQLDDRWGQALVTNNMGQSGLLRQRYEEAEKWLQKSLALRWEFGNRWAIAFVLNNLGRLKLRQGRLAEARTFAEESLTIRREYDDRQGSASCLLNLGDITLAMNDVQTAEKCYLEGLQTAVEIQNDSLSVSALLGVAKLLARPENNEVTLALELLALVAQHRAGTNELRAEAETLAVNLAAQFPPAEAEEHQRRGRERPLPAVTADLLAHF